MRREALRAFDRASDADPRRVLAYVLAAEVSAADGDALRRLEQGLAQNPGSVLLRSRIWSVQAHASQTDPAGVDRWVEEARGAVSQRALEDLRREAQVIKAALLTRDQHILAAAQFYEAALEQSSHPAHLMARGRLYEWLGWGDDARRDYERVLAIQSDHADAHLTLATMAFDRADEIGAREHIQEVLVVEPRHPGALVLQARLLQQEGDFEAAAQALGRALELGSRRADVLAEFGSVNLRLKQFERWLEYLSSAVAAAPGNGRYAADHALALCIVQNCVGAADLSQLSDFCRLGTGCGAEVAERVHRVMALFRDNDEAAYGELRRLVDDVAAAQG